MDEALGKNVTKAEEIRGELVALEKRVINEDDLREALARFDPVWDQLFPKEKARVSALLIERVTYDAKAGEVEITLRPGGIRILAQDQKKETA